MVDVIICGFEVYMFSDFVSNTMVRQAVEKRYQISILITLFIYIYGVNNLSYHLQSTYPAMQNMYVFANVVFVPLGLLASSVLLFPKDELKRKVQVTILFYTISCLIEMIGGLITGKIVNLNHSYLAMYFLVLAEKTINFIMLKCIIKFKVSYEKTDSKTFLCFMLLPFSTLVINFAMILISMNFTQILKYKLLLSSGGIGLLIANALIFSIYEQHLKVLEQNRIKSLYHLRMEENYKYYQALIENNSKISALAHDFNNKLNTIYLLAAEGHLDKIKEITQANIDKLKEVKIIQYTPNATLNAILYRNAELALKENVAFTIDVQPGFSCGILEEDDVCVVFSNLYDNSQEAAAHCDSEKFIKSKFYYDKNNMIISITNRYNPKFICPSEDGFASNKLDQTLHGFGLKNVRDIIELKYDGIFSCKTIEDIFAATIVISSNRN